MSKKIIKTSKRIENFLSILFWFVIIRTGIMAIEKIIVLFGGNEEMLKEADATISLNFIEITLLERYSMEQIKKLLIIVLINIIVLGAISCYAILGLRQIFRSMSQGKPFVSSVSSALKRLAWTSLVYGILSNILKSIYAVVSYKTLDIASLFAADKVSASKISVDLDEIYFIGFILLLFLSWVFKYGEELQTLEDETL